MKPTYQQVEDLVKANAALGGTFNKVIQGSGGKETVEPVPYRFGAKSKEIRSAAAHNLRLLRPVAEQIADERNGLLLEMSGQTGHIPDSDGPLLAKYNLAERQLMKTPLKEDLALEPIAEEDLNLEQNPIPPAIVAILALIPPLPEKKTDA